MPFALHIEVNHAPTLNFAMEQAGVPIVLGAHLRNEGIESIDGAVLSIEVHPAVASPFDRRLDRLEPGRSVELGVLDLRLEPGRLRGILEAEKGRVLWSVRVGDEVLERGEGPIDVLAFNEWAGMRASPALLATFVTPNHPVIAGVLRRVRDRLQVTTGDNGITGYQARSPERVLAMFQALYDTVQSLGISYVGTAASFETGGQKVRFADVVLAEQLGNCLDLSVLVASCLEQMGLAPILVVVKEHAFCGVWLIDERFPECIVYDAARLRTCIALGHLLFLDSSTMVVAPPLPFEKARAAAQEILAADADFHCAIDVRVARLDKYRPLPIRDVRLLEPALDSADASARATTAILQEANRENPIADAPQRPAPAPEVADRFRRWRDQLLDLSLRNKLLHSRLETKTVLPLDVPDLAQFEDLLAANTSFEVMPRPEVHPLDARDPNLVGARVDAEDLRALRIKDLARGIVHSRYTEAKMLAHAVELDRTARSDLEEGGANTLFLALGFLRWFESADSKEPRLAPLLLLPVTLDYKRNTRRVRLRQLEEDPVPNVTLIEKLRRDFAVDLSPLAALGADESGLDVPAMLRLARTAIQRVPRWEILEQAHLGLFSFAKFLMWRDLEENADVLLENETVRHIALGRGKEFPNARAAADPRCLDDDVQVADLPLVLDADATQTAAIVSALAGRTLVLQGPPGTGKSQTITNLIAAAMGVGKSVLFVSEKMAALEVVHGRLQQAGLGDFCLELHSHKAQKREVVRSLSAALNRTVETPSPPWPERSAELSRQRSELNAYSRALHTPRALGRSFYRASARLLAVSSAHDLRLRMAHIGELTEIQFRELLDSARRLATAAAIVEPVSASPWTGCAPPAWSFEFEQRARDLVEAGIVDLKDAMRAASPLAAALGLPAPKRIDHAGELGVLGLALSGGALPTSFADEGRWSEVRERVARWIDASVVDGKRRADLAARWDDAFLTTDLEDADRRFATWATAFFLLAWVFLFTARRRLRAHARGQLPGNRQIATDLVSALATKQARPAIDNDDRGLRREFGTLWSGSAAELEVMVRRGEDVRSAIRGYAARVGGSGADRAAQSLTEPTAALERGAAGTHATALMDALARWNEHLGALLPTVGAPRSIFSANIEFGGAQELLERWRSAFSRFRPWCLYTEAAKDGRAAGLSAIVEAHAGGHLRATDVETATERAILHAWVGAVRDQEPALRAFDGPNRHRLVHEFRRADAAHVALARQRIVSVVEHRLPRLDAAAAASSEPGILRRESMKKTRYLPIRKLLQQIPNLLPRLKPCLMMSPLSVAQYLPASGKRFDLVVFDEASQICTHDAIGAIARGNQVLVVGDSRQLPPTSFFQRGTTEDAAIDENDTIELESVLEEAIAAGLPEQMLGWHYRSRHETLIEFSNQHYYDGRLHLFPAARGREAGLGVHWHPVPRGIYDGGKTRTNRVEAVALVEHLVTALCTTAPTARSFGVVTFSQAQQSLVQDLLDEARAKYPEIEPHFASSAVEPVFVKNLENVQGDERDEILFSIGYGPDAQGRVIMNFGPLNRTGGERRLNVAITRARQALRVFSTLTHDQIDPARTTARGAHDLKSFLRFVAERGGPVREQTTLSGDFDSEFERGVYEALVTAGHRVQTQVGSGGYRIDLAILHPTQPGAFVLGVECDGAAYHSGATARDRDRLRQAVLEGLGWRMHRIWSTDWWFDRAGELARLAEALAHAVEQWNHPPVTTIASAPPPPFAELTPTPPPISVRSPAVPYVRTRLESFGTDPEDLYAKSNEHLVRKHILEVIHNEAPVHVDELARRVGTTFGAVRLTSRVRRRIEEVVDALSPRPVIRGDFVWRTDADAGELREFRVPADGDDAREAESIAPEEIAAAARWVLSRGLSMTEDDLVKETMRVFGISRRGQRVGDRMLTGVEVLMRSGECERSGTRLVWRGAGP